MRHHKYRWWGLGHMSDPGDPQGCCNLPEDHPIHQPETCGCGCGNPVGDS